MDRLLITGATGFIGRAVVRSLLDAGHVVGAVVRPGSDTTPLDDRASRLVADGSTEGLAQAVQDFRPDAAIHAATYFRAQHVPSDIAPMIEANLLFGCQLFDALMRAGCTRVVNFGTTWQHFDSAAYRPVSIYAATKQAFEDLAVFYCDACGFRTITLRLTDTYGPDDTRAKLLPFLLKIAASGDPLPMSPGAQLVNFIHIDDVINAVKVALRRTADSAPGAEVFTVAGDEQLALRDFVERVSQAIGRPLNIQWGARPYRDREVMDPWLGLRLPDWTPRISLDQGLRDVAGGHV